MHDTNLLQLVSEDIGTAQQLLELIDAEYQALGQRDLPRLQDILAQKLPLLSLLDQHGSARSRLLAENPGRAPGRRRNPAGAQRRTERTARQLPRRQPAQWPGDPRQPGLADQRTGHSARRRNPGAL
jgi:hypothetical protein